MDWVAVTIGLGVCCITAVILYLISVFSFKEKTFEEALAEQQIFVDSLLKGEKSNTREKEKKPKKSSKKNKEKEKREVFETAAVAVATSSVTYEEKPHVEFEPDTEIIPEEIIQIHSEIEKKKTDKKEKVKPILRNVESINPTPNAQPDSFDPDLDTVNHFVENPPKDEAELKAKEGKHGKNKGPKAVEEKVVEVPVVEPVAVKETAFTVGVKVPAVQSQQQHGTPKKQQRKKNTKNDSVETDGGEELLLLFGGTEKLMSALRRLPLTAAELQTVIEILLNRQQEASGTVESEWMERGGRLDPIGALRKQLSDKEKMLQEELEEKQVYQNKLRTLGTEMTAERTRSAQARKQLEDNLSQKTSEVAGLSMKIQQLMEQHAAEVADVKRSFQQAQKASQVSEDTLRQLQRLQEDKAQLEGRFSAIQQDLGSRIQQLEDILRHKDQQVLEMRHIEQQRLEQEMGLKNQLSIMASQLQELEQIRPAMMMESEKHHQAQQELGQLREVLARTEQQAMQATARFEEAERAKQMLEERIATFGRDLLMERNMTAQKESESNQELSRLLQDNQSLAQQLATAQAHRENSDGNAEALLRDKEAALAVERSSAARLESEVQRLGAENQSLMEQIAESQARRSEQQLADSRLESQIRDRDAALEQQRCTAAQREAEVERLGREKEDLALQLSQLAAAQQDAVDARLKEKEEELEAQRAKNNELRDKNYKAMDALAEAEKALVEAKKSKSSTSSSPEDVQKAVVASLLKVFPQLQVDASSPPSSFAETISSQLSSLKSRLEEEEQSKAQAQVLHYKTVLSQTEELLNRLQSRVEAEEQSWKSKMAQLSSDLATLKTERQFWMDQCQKQEAQQPSTDQLATLQSQVESLQKEKDQQLQEKEKQLLEKSSSLDQIQQQLNAAEETLSQERHAVQLLREQLDRAKAEASAAKVGSIGYMVGWAKGHSSAATVAAATIAKNSVNLNTQGSSPSSLQDGVVTKADVAATNGNGTSAEISPEEWSVPASQPLKNTSGNHKNKNRKKKAASHFAS